MRIVRPAGPRGQFSAAEPAVELGRQGGRDGKAPRVEGPLHLLDHLEGRDLKVRPAVEVGLGEPLDPDVGPVQVGKNGSCLGQRPPAVE